MPKTNGGSDVGATKGRGRSGFARSVPRAAKRTAGRTSAERTPLNIRTAGVAVPDDVRESARRKLGAKLGKYAALIERVSVRFEDENGPRGGVDTVCRIKIVLSGRDSILFEARATSPGEALQLAVQGVERAARRTVQRAGLRAGTPRSNATKTAAKRASGGREARTSTAARNRKKPYSGATTALEDSATGRPSRKSTRKSANRSKPDSNLQRREMRRTQSPTARAERAVKAR